MRPMIGIALYTLLAVAGCNVTIPGSGPAVVGSGVTKEEAREVPDFTGIDVSASLEAIVTIGPKSSVTISADDNILPLIKTDVKDGKLEVGYAPGQTIRTTKAPKVSIAVPALKSLATHGASKATATPVEGSAIELRTDGASSIELKGISANTIDAKAEGASTVTLAGAGRRLTLEVSGASRLFAAEAPFESAKVTIEGASRGEVNVTGSVEGRVDGASSLKVRGDPKTRSVQTSGASGVTY